ncbi:penicillin-binding protein 1C [Sediminicola luteus]|uniref:peptidoglycan glycosyltransferase n=1 Tax=Sediminicola luteus TaxID=319238 RepID=A0A2A4G5C9_9FLAO|nr:penicillin-binding protein 1C [Sediminicola luteus]
MVFRLGLTTITKRLGQYIVRHPLQSTLFLITLIGYYFCLPQTLFNQPTATVVHARNGELLGAKIAADGQWRFPALDSVPKKFEHCLLAFEDGYFYQHPGFNPVAMGKALGANLAQGRVVRGGSTITQQLIRLHRGQKGRTYSEKLWELVLATRAEWRYTKKEILALYASHAPFGGNVVGLPMAAYRYYGLSPDQLSWAEAATLAVLPNAPGLIFPGKRQERLKKKRDFVLKKLFDQKVLDSTTYQLALLEPLPNAPYALPKTATHLVAHLGQTQTGQNITTTLDYNLQERINQIVSRHHRQLVGNQVHNAAVLVVDTKTREVLAYVGNSPTDKAHEKDVDMVRANRSTGSLLKPLLYAAALDAGELSPTMLVADVPTHIAGYNPENFSKTYAGAVMAKTALAKSLNVPAVRILQNYGLQKFRAQLDAFKLKGINKPADHYGLTLALGGAEANLWDLTKVYASMGSTVMHFTQSSSEYYPNEIQPPILEKGKQADFGLPTQEKTTFDAASVYLTLEALKEVNRPESNQAWQFFDSARPIAWKTGTSFGNKDAWAIGVTPEFTVGVWVGNADGEGRPGITGLTAAAPVLFDIFGSLPQTSWFPKPFDAFKQVALCTQSGFLATEVCTSKTVDIPNTAIALSACPYHHWVHLNPQTGERVNSSCFEVSAAQKTAWFSLPPLMEWYFAKNQAQYQILPPFQKGCEVVDASPMAFIYPAAQSRISLTKDFDGEINPMVARLAHSDYDSEVFWYLNSDYVGHTKQYHEMELWPKTGAHTLTATDAEGHQIQVKFSVD